MKKFAVKNPLPAVKNHVDRNRTKYAFAAGLAAGYVAFSGNRKQFNEFLEEKGLTDEFYLPDTPEENN